jgi:hypothetical protein
LALEGYYYGSDEQCAEGDRLKDRDSIGHFFDFLTYEKPWYYEARPYYSKTW